MIIFWKHVFKTWKFHTWIERVLPEFFFSTRIICNYFSLIDFLVFYENLFLNINKAPILDFKFSLFGIVKLLINAKSLSLKIEFFIFNLILLGAIVNGGILPVNDTIFFHFLLLFKSLLTSSFVSFVSFVSFITPWTKSFIYTDPLNEFISFISFIYLID